jgi:hypothetical protein
MEEEDEECSWVGGSWVVVPPRSLVHTNVFVRLVAHPARGVRAPWG